MSIHQAFQQSKKEFREKFDSRFYGKPKLVAVDVNAVESHLTQTVVRVLEEVRKRCPPLRIEPMSTEMPSGLRRIDYAVCEVCGNSYQRTEGHVCEDWLSKEISLIKEDGDKLK